MSRAVRHHGFRRLCERSGVTVCEVAHVAGFVPTHLSNWLAGRVSDGSAQRIEAAVAPFFFGPGKDALAKFRRAMKWQPRGMRS